LTEWEKNWIVTRFFESSLIQKNKTGEAPKPISLMLVLRIIATGKQLSLFLHCIITSKPLFKIKLLNCFLGIDVIAIKF
jgi:hypothetical protein